MQKSESKEAGAAQCCAVDDEEGRDAETETRRSRALQRALKSLAKCDLPRLERKLPESSGPDTCGDPQRLGVADVPTR